MGKLVVITGGSRGIGAATAVLAAEKGYDVAINFVSNVEAAKETADIVVSKGVKVGIFKADVSDEVQVRQMFDEIRRQMGPIHALVNNAGILEKLASLEEIDASRINRIFRTNVTGSMICAKEALKGMTKGCSIVNLSSVAATWGSPGEFIDYAASKGAIDSFTVGLSREVAGKSIRVNGVRPGFIETEIHKKSGLSNRVNSKINIIPLKRIGQPLDVAYAIMWLISDEASYVTGSILNVTGGR